MTNLKAVEKTREAHLSGQGAVIKVEVSIPEAVAAIEAFAANHLAALDALSRGFRAGVAEAFNQLLKTEMSLFLGCAGQQNNKRNGFRAREYSLKGIGTLQLHVPRDRDGEFDSAVVPSSERVDPRLREDIALLHLAGISSRMLETIAVKVLGMNVSRDTVSACLGPLQEAAQKWLTRPLDGRYWALYIDATNINIRRRGSVEKEPSLVVVGVNETNRRSILAVEPGSRETVESWRAAFAELKRRGLKPSTVRVGVMDGLPGLENAFREFFPKAVTARCWVHASKNAVAKAPARLREPFKQLAEKVMYASSEDAARKAFGRLKEAMDTDAQRAVACLEKDLDALVAHYRFDRRFWQALKTANPVERVHREIKRRVKVMDAVGEGNLNVLIAFTALRLEAGWKRQRVDSRSIYNLSPKGKAAIEGQEATRAAIDELTTAHERAGTPKF